MHKTSCLQSIKNLYSDLTEAEKKVAQYILNHADHVITMPIATLAQQSGVAKSAVIRCCKSLGFAGYADLKVSLIMELSKNKELNYSPYIAKDDHPGDILEKIFSSNIKTLHDTAANIDRASLDSMVDLLEKAENIYIYAIGTSSCIAHDFQYRLMQLGRNAFCFTDVPTMKVSTMNIKKGDVAIGISNSGRTIATIDALVLAKESGATTCCITSYHGSEITKHTAYSLEIYSDEIQYPIEAISSRIAHLSLIDVLTVSLSARNYEDTWSRAKQTRRLIDSIRYEGGKK